MNTKSRIEWTDATWNPITGCTKVSDGCDNCYAERFAKRWIGVKGHPYEYGFELRHWQSRIDTPLKWRKPRMIFVNSMSDLFHKNIAPDFLDKIFDTMETANQHIYQVLTKRSTLMRRYLLTRYPTYDMPKHIWCGVTIENNRYQSRLNHLLDSPANVKFLSIEPLLGPIETLNLSGIHWVIVGGESGPGARPMKSEWVRDIRDTCSVYDVPFFFKQWGGLRPKSGGRLFDGREYNEMPQYLNESEILAVQLENR